VIVCGRCSERR